MLRHLSFLNAKRQLTDYMIYFVTILFSVVLLYGFNSLLFSPEMAPIMEAQMSGVRPLIYFVSFLIVGILGWLVNYMIKFMLSKRGRELGTYMLLGISNGRISRMIILENSFFGFFALFIGIPFGVLFSEILKSLTMIILGQAYTFNLQFSINGTLLTILYVLLIFFVALLLNQRQLKRLSLKDLIYLQSTVTKVKYASSVFQISLFLLSIIGLLCGVYCFIKLPFGNAYDILFGIFGCTAFMFLFFESISGVLIFWIEHHKEWLYKKNRLIVYRTFTAKMSSLKRTLQALGVLFMLAILVLALSVSFSKIIEMRQRLIAFDVMILHQDSDKTMRDYDSLLAKMGNIESSHKYTLYHDRKESFSEIRNRLKSIESGNDNNLRENKYDTYIGFSDYQALRKMLHLEPVAMDDSQFLIHCSDYLKNDLINYGDNHSLSLKNRTLKLGGTYSESFNQYSDYGNGSGFLLVIPDNLVRELQVLYSLYAAQVNLFDNEQYLANRIKSVPNLTSLLDEQSTSIEENDTLLTSEDDYIFGRKIEKEKSEGVPMILPLALLGVIFCIAGATILAVQILSDRPKNVTQNILLSYLGEEEKERRRVLRNQLILYFLAPIVPALIVGNILNWIMLIRTSMSSFNMPVFSKENSLIDGMLFVNLIFLVIYTFYGLVVYRQVRSKINE